MPNFTTNYNVEDQNGNMDIIDTNIKSQDLKFGILNKDLGDFKQTTTTQMADNMQQVENKMNKVIKDDSTTKKYELGIKNGLLYYREVI